MLNEATTTAPPPSRTPRRCLRRGTLISLIALALLAGEGYRRHRNWQNFLQDLEEAGAPPNYFLSRKPAFENWWLPGWMQYRFPFVRKEASLQLGNWADDRWLLDHGQALRSSCIFEVILQGTAVTDTGLQVFRDHPTLRGLALNGKLYSPNCLLTLGHLRNLTGLHLPEVSLSKTSMKQLATWPKLNSLGCDASSPGLSQLGSLRELESLGLVHTTDDSIGMIPTNCTIRWLLLQRSEITDASVPFLLKLPNLEVLSLDRPRLSSEGRRKLSEAGIVISDSGESQ